MSLKNIQSLYRKKLAVQKDLLEEIKRTFPVGSIVDFKKGNALIHAAILDYTESWHTDPSCKIRNIDTGNSYWINTYWFAR